MPQFKSCQGASARPAPFADTLPGTAALLYAPRMSWRNKLKLADLPAGEALESHAPNAVLPAMRRRQNYERSEPRSTRC